MNGEPVTLLWLGSEARLAGSDGRPGPPVPIPPQDPAAALARQLAEEFPGAGAVRLLYQPPALAIETIAAAELPERRPALRRRGCIWSVEAGPPASDELLLASEPNSPLPDLARRLEDQGLRVEGAWTLASLLEAMPRGPDEGPACLRLVILGCWALLASTDAQSRRRLRLFGIDSSEEMTSELRALLATFDEQRPAPAWTVLEDEAWPSELRATIRRLIPAEIPLAALLAQARRLPREGPSDFLRPDRRRFRLSRPVALGAGFVFGLAALLAGWRAHEAAADRRRQRLFQVAAGAAARDAHLASVQKLDAINRALAQAIPPRYRLDLLLLALSRAITPEIRLSEIASQGPSFLIRGRLLGPDAAAGDTLGKFRRDLSADPADWTWTQTPPPAGGDFLWRGSFRLEAPVPARTPEEGSARLAQALGQLPSRGPAEDAVAFLTRGWTGGAVGEPAEPGRRLYRFGPPSRRLAVWSDIVATVQALAAEPGVTLEGLELEAGEEASDAFAQARVDIGVQFRRDEGGESGPRSLPGASVRPTWLPFSKVMT